MAETPKPVPQPLPRNEARFRYPSPEPRAVITDNAKGDLMETTMANFDRLFASPPGGD